MTKKVRTAVFPVAGLGTRFLPATKAMPKEMLPVVDRPLIQYAVDEAREAGIEHFVFVTGRNKGVIEDHFDRQVELEITLHQRQKNDMLQMLSEGLPKPGQTSFTRQQEPLGLGHAVWCARDIVGNEPFALLLPDMLMRSKPGVLSQMIDSYNERGGNVIAVEEVDPKEISSYGVVGRGKGEDNAFDITEMIEKPSVEKAPSNLIISGRYILQPEIFDLLSKQSKGAGGEIQITDAMVKLMEHDRFTGVKYDGHSFDCGSKVGFLTANVVFAMDREDIAEEFKSELRKVVKELFNDVSIVD
ncbi:UTP--glucose-1-phosphate uridylyltransferase GalU [Maritalea sp.]|uniref:UTP--glucose-1-phosphate uridylyltransferase GalU n=1 Tax=Maritalea sp. TaxID=2003361 RepID=UPI003F4ABA88